jgi:glycogen phosphorylase
MRIRPRDRERPSVTLVQPDLPVPADPVAYFCMEVALASDIPTYAGGLGVLAGDFVRGAADASVPLIVVTLVHRKGYLRQRLDTRGRQMDRAAAWQPKTRLEAVRERVAIALEERVVHVGAWRAVVPGVRGSTVSVYLLDTDVTDNQPEDRMITDALYGGDERNRLMQEAVLGLGGVALLQALGVTPRVYHMNEGHAALLTLALLADEPKLVDRAATAGDRVRERCVFTTHTPVPAGHDRFPISLVRQVLGPELSALAQKSGAVRTGVLNMTALALRYSRYVNGVAMRHGEIAAKMFPRYPINAITNGVHAVTWAAPPMAQLFDKYMPQWRHDNRYLRYAMRCPVDAIREAHMSAKTELIAAVARRSKANLDPRALLIGFARRATPYKRANLIFHDVARLRSIARRSGPLQLLFAGKAHPQDDGGKQMIESVVAAAKALRPDVAVFYLEDYDIVLAQQMVAGVDLWLNTPRKPLEASGTSGMKAALNGVPSLSVLDGWWVEGHIESVTGWRIGDESLRSDDAKEADSLYRMLEDVILPMFHQRPLAYAAVMRGAIAHNGSFFTAQRMVAQYVEHAYRAPRS